MNQKYFCQFTWKASFTILVSCRAVSVMLDIFDEFFDEFSIFKEKLTDDSRLRPYCGILSELYIRLAADSDKRLVGVEATRSTWTMSVAPIIILRSCMACKHRLMLFR
jgi:hypothetical protein